MRPVNSNQFASLSGSSLERRRKEKEALKAEAYWAKSIGGHGNGGTATLPMLTTPSSPLLHRGAELSWVSFPLKTTFTSSPNSIFFFSFFLGKGMKQWGKPIILRDMRDSMLFRDHLTWCWESTQGRRLALAVTVPHVPHPHVPLLPLTANARQYVEQIQEISWWFTGV